MNNNNLNSYDLLKKSLIKSSSFLLARQVIVYSFNLFGAISLARMVTISDFGFFAVISFFYLFLASFCESGLVASLIRQKDQPSNYEYSVIFTCQFLLTIFIIIIFLLFTSFIIKYYNFDSESIIIFLLISLGLFLSTFSIIPLTISQRNLFFNQIAYYDVIQAVVFNLILVLLVYYDYGLISFAIAILFKVVISNIYIITRSPWKIDFNFNWILIKSHLSFGMHYQGVRIISLFKDSFTPFFIGALIGSVAVGYLNWINLIALFPTMAIFLLQKMYMPYFSKLQSDKIALSTLVGNMMWATNFIVAPLSILTILLIHPITQIIFGDKWLIAIPYFYFIWFSNLLVPTASVFIGLFDAVGMSKVNFKYSLLWMIMNWGLGIPAVYFWGLYGFVFSVLITQFTNIFLFIDAKKYVYINYKNIFLIWILALFSALLVLFFYQKNNIDSIYDLILFSFCNFLLYFIFTFFTFRNKFLFIFSFFNKKTF